MDALATYGRFSPRHRSRVQQWSRLVGATIVAAALVLLPFHADRTDTLRYAEVAAIAVAVMGLNLVTGLSGQISLGHGAFMGVGAFSTAVLVVDHHWSFFATLPVAAVLCFVSGVLIGLPALRLKGLYLAMATFGLGIIFPKLVERYDFTGGANGKRLSRNKLVAPAWTRLEDQQFIYFVVVAIAVVLFVGARNIIRSRPGRALVALRDNPIGAEVSGIDLARHKVIAFGLSAAYAGLAGSLLMFLNTGSGLAKGTSFSLDRSIELLSGLVIGGLATVAGPAIGAAVVVWLPVLISDHTDRTNPRNGAWATIVYGVSLIGIMFAYPGGLAGFFATFRRKVVSIGEWHATARGPAGDPRETRAASGS
jgi:branched-chain amino acid transport system permease protein